MKYVATINGKKYEVEVEKLEAYKSLDRNGVAAPAAPVLPASAPVQRPAAPAPVAAPVAEPAVEDVTDDGELIAVIAAAIAASEGKTSTDGFVVRSIRKVNRRKR